MTAIENRPEPIPVAVACDVLGVSRATLYRSRRPLEERAARRAALVPRRLGAEERARLRDTLHSPKFADQPPAEVYATLLGLNIYLASIRTMYRVLAAEGEVIERRNQRQNAGPRISPIADCVNVPDGIYSTECLQDEARVSKDNCSSYCTPLRNCNDFVRETLNERRYSDPSTADRDIIDNGAGRP